MPLQMTERRSSGIQVSAEEVLGLVFDLPEEPWAADLVAERMRSITRDAAPAPVSLDR
jgi:hypothetical protein